MNERLVTHRGPRNTQLLHDLIQARGIPMGTYAFFFTTGEGTALPISRPGDDVEERSGFVLDKQRRVFFFWFGWDPQTQAAALTTWEQVEPEADWADDPEYQGARKRVGLPPA